MIVNIGWSRQVLIDALSVLNKLYDLTHDEDAKYDIKVFDNLNDITHDPEDYTNGLNRLRKFATAIQDQKLNEICNIFQTEIEKQSELIDIDLDSKDIEILKHIKQKLRLSDEKQHVLSCLNFDVSYQITNNLYDFTKQSKQTRFKCELALNTLKDYSIVYKENIDILIKKFEEKL